MPSLERRPRLRCYSSHQSAEASDSSPSG